jgi:hypothetical protein
MIIASLLLALSCATGTIDRSEPPSPLMHITYAPEGIRLAFVGDYLWVQTGDSVDEYDGTVSYEIPADASWFEACPDGVTFDRPEIIDALIIEAFSRPRTREFLL